MNDVADTVHIAIISITYWHYAYHDLQYLYREQNDFNNILIVRTIVKVVLPDLERKL